MLALTSGALPDRSNVFRADVLRKNSLSNHLVQKRPGKRNAPLALPDIACFPYRSAPRHWAFFVAQRASPSDGPWASRLFASARACNDAWAATTAYVPACSGCSVEAGPPLDAAEYTDILRLLVAVASACGTPVAAAVTHAQSASPRMNELCDAFLNARSSSSAPEFQDLAVDDVCPADLPRKVSTGVLGKTRGDSLTISATAARDISTKPAMHPSAPCKKRRLEARNNNPTPPPLNQTATQIIASTPAVLHPGTTALPARGLLKRTRPLNDNPTVTNPLARLPKQACNTAGPI